MVADRVGKALNVGARGVANAQLGRMLGALDASSSVPTGKRRQVDRLDGLLYFVGHFIHHRDARRPLMAAGST